MVTYKLKYTTITTSLLGSSDKIDETQTVIIDSENWNLPFCFFGTSAIDGNSSSHYLELVKVLPILLPVISEESSGETQRIRGQVGVTTHI